MSNNEKFPLPNPNQDPLERVYEGAGLVNPAARADAAREGLHPDVDAIKAVRDVTGGTYGEYPIDGVDLGFMDFSLRLDDLGPFGTRSYDPGETSAKLRVADTERVANEVGLATVGNRLDEIAVEQEAEYVTTPRLNRLFGRTAVLHADEKAELMARTYAMRKRQTVLPTRDMHDGLAKKLLRKRGAELHESAVEAALKDGVEIVRS